jgi:aconitate hydratase
MGILPLQYLPGESSASLGLSGRESFTIEGLAELRPRQEVAVVARAEDGSETRFRAIARLDGDIDVTYYRNGGVLQTVLRRLASGG